MKLFNGLFRGKKEHDDSFFARLVTVRRNLEQGTIPKPKELLDRLNELEKRTEPSRMDLNELHDIEAASCLYIETELLYPMYLRLRDRIYRLRKSVREDWSKELQRLFPDGENIQDETVARKRLTALGREINSETAEFIRRTSEKAQVLLRLNAVGIILVIVFVAISAFLVPVADSKSFLGLLVPVALIGGVGSTISAIRKMRNEKLRDEYQKLLQVELFVRSFLGLFYASFVFACVTINILPMKAPEGQELAFFLVLGFISGFSDSYFGQAVGRFVTQSNTSEKE